jgi:hypothetical protein
MTVITRQEARALGYPRYSDPSRPCSRCGCVERHTSSASCVSCALAAKKRSRVQKRIEKRESLGLTHDKVEGDFSDPLSDLELALARDLFMATLRIRFVSAMGAAWLDTYSRNLRAPTTLSHSTRTDHD